MNTKILVIDDEEDIVEYVSCFLSQFDFDIIAAYNGAEAISVLNTNLDVKLIISDIRMPVMDGICMIKAIRILSKYDHIPIIIHSGAGEEALINAVAALGVKDWLVKPTESKFLTETIRDKLKIA